MISLDMLWLLFQSFTSKMLVICVVGGRLVERFRGIFFSLGQTMLVAKLAISKNSQVSCHFMDSGLASLPFIRKLAS